MRLLLDESVPVKFRRALPNHDVRTVVEMGWSGVNNGKLLALAANGFDAFVTVDRQESTVSTEADYTSRICHRAGRCVK